MMDVDFWGVVNGTKAFLPHLIASGDGHVVNVSSVFGIFSVPGQAAYNAAKFAVRGFTEALRQEMQVGRAPGEGHDGAPRRHQDRRSRATRPPSRASISRNSPRPSTRNWHARRRRRPPTIILEAVRKNKARVLVGADAKALDIVVRLTGSGYQRLFALATSRVMPKSR